MWQAQNTSLMYIVYCYIISDTMWQALSSGGSNLDVNYPICIFMNIYENLKNDRKIIGGKTGSNDKNLDP